MCTSPIVHSNIILFWGFSVSLHCNSKHPSNQSYNDELYHESYDGIGESVGAHDGTVETDGIDETVGDPLGLSLGETVGDPLGLALGIALGSKH
mmetsp:Transcript_33936/g.55418  ORF Transcript_33936/g.55418 Transcript_33936/m.55418 type:complete len:94 (-) Transcript_33936:998-1279(-)